MRLLLRGDFDRVALLGHVHRVRRRRLAHKGGQRGHRACARCRARAGPLAGDAPAQTQAHRQHDGRRQRVRPVPGYGRRAQRAAQARRDGLVEHLGVQGLQAGALRLEGGRARGGLGVLGQPLRDGSGGVGRQLVVHPGVERGFVGGAGGHWGVLHYLMALSTVRVGAPPSISCRSCARARDSRDITVPTGTPSVSAVSA